jgi:shikimate dehydrogenase
LTARLGVVNTVYLEGNRLMGISTDGPGFLSHLRESQPQLHLAATPALILGAGGAAQAIAGALLEAGCPSLTVANRNHDRAVAMSDKFGPRLHPVPWAEAEAAMASVGLLVNTTALGMTGQPPLTIDLARLAATAVVCDIVYTPLQTNLLRKARDLGLATVDGLGMLLHQAVPGFEKWFGQRPVVTPALRSLVEADLGKVKPK